MHTALHQRIDREDEEGFTLIELMVVVLIIGILLAIAIPTFLGARDRANDRSAQSNLRNALTAEKTLFTDNSTFTDSQSVANVSILNGIEPSLTWSASVLSTNPRVVSATIPAGATNSGSVVLADQSATGTCFYIGDTGGPTGIPGTFYASSTASPCVAPTTLPGTGTVLPHTDGNGAWASAF